MNKDKKGFTLAEVLITLTILGVIAALTVPSIIRNYQDRAAVTNVKRAFAMFDTVIQQAIAVDGPIATWDWPSLRGDTTTTNSNYFAEKINRYLQVDKYCGSANGCFQYGFDKNCSKLTSGSPYFKTLKGACGVYGTWTENTSYANGGKTRLKNGMTYSVSISFPQGYPLLYYGTMTGTVGNIKVDINGAKGPNRFGYDVFFFSIHRTIGLSPYQRINNHASSCSMFSTTNDMNDGYTCYSWILEHGNMDYKRKDVSSQWTVHNEMIK